MASIFVNPKQFAPNEDLETYPRDTVRDLVLLGREGVDLVFMPNADEMYPPGFGTEIRVGDVARGLCGASRPHFFAGVATVVAKLLLQCRPDRAYFGEKDYQQLLVIRRMVRDLDIPVEVVGCPIVRESDGLAMSSRNAYLGSAERRTAPLLFETLMEAARRAGAGEALSSLESWARDRLAAEGFTVDYVEFRHARSLAAVNRGAESDAPLRLLAAAMLGHTRLIDNVAVPDTKADSNGDAAPA